MQTVQIDALRERMRGRIIDATDPDYDEARAVYNGMIDRQPSAVVRISQPADALAAVGCRAVAGWLLPGALDVRDLLLHESRRAWAT